MIEIAVAGAAGFAVTLLLLRMAGLLLAHPLLMRDNYRGVRLPTAAGIVLIAAVVLVEGGRAGLWIAGGFGGESEGVRTVAMLAVVGFGLLGLVDDLLGDAADRGLRGHILAALHGRLTTGFLKLAVGAALGLSIAAALGDQSRPQVLVDGAVIALAANLGNLLDRAPGRASKWSLAAGAVLVAVAGQGTADPVLAVVLGGAAALLLGDLRERFMLGDTGANALGAAVGVATVVGLGTGTRQVVMAVLLGLTALSEVLPFSRVIAAVPPLRWIDEAGRIARDPTGPRPAD